MIVEKAHQNHGERPTVGGHQIEIGIVVETVVEPRSADQRPVRPVKSQVRREASGSDAQRDVVSVCRRKAPHVEITQGDRPRRNRAIRQRPAFVIRWHAEFSRRLSEAQAIGSCAAREETADPHGESTTVGGPEREVGIVIGAIVETRRTDHYAARPQHHQPRREIRRADTEHQAVASIGGEGVRVGGASRERFRVINAIGQRTLGQHGC